MAIGGAAVIIPVAVQGAIELIRLGGQLLDTWKNNPEDQAALDKLWAEMQTARDAAIGNWEASKAKNNQ